MKKMGEQKKKGEKGAKKDADHHKIKKSTFDSSGPTRPGHGKRETR